MNNDQKINNIFLLLNIVNINVIYYIHNNPDLLECVYNNSILLKLFIGLYKHFIQEYKDQVHMLTNKLAQIEESTLNPNAKDYIPAVYNNVNEHIPSTTGIPEFDVFTENIEHYLPRDLLN